MDEPTAAILAAGMADSDVDKLVLVFDWGGGTFDISILEITDAVSTEAKNGNMDLGGRDLDEALVDYCLMKFKE
jgi:molecular chaperone DnaK